MSSIENKKHQFLIGMEALKSQYNHDVEYANRLSAIHNNAEIPVYNNEILINGMIKLLAAFFDDQNQAVITIKQFMYESNFGKSTEQTPKDIWEYLWNKNWSNFFNS